jgi:peptidoglycan/xylan/chitin deacetylase (PgdA/CDA1 family)
MPDVHDTLVLCYHAVSERWPADLSVRPAELARQLGYLRDRGYRSVTFEDAVRGPHQGRRVAITFDDAYTSVKALAKPILDRLNWVATVFAVSSFASTGGRLRWDGIAHWETTEHARELEGLDWDGLRELGDAGWEVGSHTVRHPRLTRLDDTALDRELTDSRAAVEDALQRPCPSIAYPYGDCDERVIAAAARAGYRAGAALPPRWDEPRPLAWPRAGVYHPDDFRRFRLKASPRVRRMRQLLHR